LVEANLVADFGSSYYYIDFPNIACFYY